MKEIILSMNTDTIRKLIVVPPEAEGANGRRCIVGFRFTSKFCIRKFSNGEYARDESGEYIYELDPVQCRLEIHPRLRGRCATWEEILLALYEGEDGNNFGEQLEDWAREAHCAREYHWRVQKERYSGYTEYRIRESDEVDREFGLAGRITSRLRITPNDKVNEGVPLNLSLADWYVFLYSIPHRPLKELEELYKDTLPRELYPIKAEWHAPGAEPWEEEHGDDAPVEDTFRDVIEMLKGAYGEEEKETDR